MIDTTVPEHILKRHPESEHRQVKMYLLGFSYVLIFVCSVAVTYIVKKIIL